MWSQAGCRCASDPCLNTLIPPSPSFSLSSEMRIGARPLLCASQTTVRTNSRCRQGCLSSGGIPALELGGTALGARAGLAACKAESSKLSVGASAACRIVHVCGQNLSGGQASSWTRLSSRAICMVPSGLARSSEKATMQQQSSLASTCTFISARRRVSSPSRPRRRGVLARANMADTLVVEEPRSVVQSPDSSAKPDASSVPLSAVDSSLLKDSTEPASSVPLSSTLTDPITISPPPSVVLISVPSDAAVDSSPLSDTEELSSNAPKSIHLTDVTKKSSSTLALPEEVPDSSSHANAVATATGSTVTTTAVEETLTAYTESSPSPMPDLSGEAISPAVDPPTLTLDTSVPPPSVESHSSLLVSSLPTSSDASLQDVPSSSTEEAGPELIWLNTQPTPASSSSPLLPEDQSLSVSAAALPYPSAPKTLTLELEHSEESTTSTIALAEPLPTSAEVVSTSASTPDLDSKPSAPVAEGSPTISLIPIATSILPSEPEALSPPVTSTPPQSSDSTLLESATDTHLPPAPIEETAEASLPSEVETTSLPPLASLPPSSDSSLEQALGDSSSAPEEATETSSPPSIVTPASSLDDSIHQDTSTLSSALAVAAGEDTSTKPSLVYITTTEVESSPPPVVASPPPSLDSTLEQASFDSDTPPTETITPVVVEPSPNLIFLDTSPPSPRAASLPPSLDVPPSLSPIEETAQVPQEEATLSSSLPSSPPSSSDVSLLHDAPSDISPVPASALEVETPTPTPSTILQVAAANSDSEADPPSIMVIASLPPTSNTAVLDRPASDIVVPSPSVEEKDSPAVIWISTEASSLPSSSPADLPLPLPEQPSLDLHKSEAKELQPVTDSTAVEIQAAETVTLSDEQPSLSEPVTLPSISEQVIEHSEAEESQPVADSTASEIQVQVEETVTLAEEQPLLAEPVTLLDVAPAKALTVELELEPQPAPDSAIASLPVTETDEASAEQPSLSEPVSLPSSETLAVELEVGEVSASAIAEEETALPEEPHLPESVSVPPVSTLETLVTVADPTTSSIALEETEAIPAEQPSLLEAATLPSSSSEESLANEVEHPPAEAEIASAETPSISETVTAETLATVSPDSTISTIADAEAVAVPAEPALPETVIIQSLAIELEHPTAEAEIASAEQASSSEAVVLSPPSPTESATIVLETESQQASSFAVAETDIASTEQPSLSEPIVLATPSPSKTLTLELNQSEIATDSTPSSTITLTETISQSAAPTDVLDDLTETTASSVAVEDAVLPPTESEPTALSSPISSSSSDPSLDEAASDASAASAALTDSLLGDASTLPEAAASISQPEVEIASPLLVASVPPSSESLTQDRPLVEESITASADQEKAPEAFVWLDNGPTQDPPSTPELLPISDAASLPITKALTVELEQPAVDSSISTITAGEEVSVEVASGEPEIVIASQPEAVTPVVVDAPLEASVPSGGEILLSSSSAETAPVLQDATGISVSSSVEEAAQVLVVEAAAEPTPAPPSIPAPSSPPEQLTVAEVPAVETKTEASVPEARHIVVVAALDEESSDAAALATQSAALPVALESGLSIAGTAEAPPSPRAPQKTQFVATVASIDTSLPAPVHPTMYPHLFPALVLSMGVTATFLSLSAWNAKHGDVELILDESNPEHKEILARCPLLKAQYEASPLVSGRHTSTLFAALFRSLPRIAFRRVCLRMPDGGTVALDWPISGDAWEDFEDEELPESAPVLILLPGLTGGSDDTYVRHLLVRARKHGWNSVVFNSRGCADSPVTTPQFYSASFTEDLREVVKHVAALHPSSRVYAVGWSLGANILVRYLGQEKGETPLTGAVSLCNPFDLVEADKQFHIGFNNVYDQNLAKGLCKIFQKHAALFEGLPEPYDIPLVANAKTVREFDDGLTRVSFGYATVDDYYLDASSSKSIPDVAVPLLCIQAEDDPIAPSVGIPKQAIADNKNTILVVTPGGGHLGWVAGEDAPFGAPWTDPLVIQYLEAIEALAAAKPPPPKTPSRDPGRAKVVDTLTHVKGSTNNGGVREPIGIR